MSRVLLVVPPFEVSYRPALGASLLKAELTRRGIDCDVLYLNLRFADLAGSRFYRRLEHGPIHYALVGEWLFAGDLFGEAAPDPQAYLRECLGSPMAEQYPADLPHQLLALRVRVGAFLEATLDRIDLEQYAVVAVDSREDNPVRHNVPALAFLRRVKARAPGVRTVLGGANCEGGVGAAIRESFPFVDEVYTGEGDRVFPRLVERLLAGEHGAGLPGVLSQHDLDVLGAGLRVPTVPNLDTLPFLDCEDYFAQLAASGLVSVTRPRLTLETSRGCWWGEKHHCTFCGLNGEGMAYRSKSGPRALAELDYLLDRHGVREVQVVDKILDQRYFQTLLPILAERTLPPRLFFEAKANLSRAQLGLLARSGVRQFQPGVESLSTPILNLMDKGVTALQNVRLLKWCAEIGLEPDWNVIFGQPGEDADEYDRMADLVPALMHLRPPGQMARIRLDRFSPNFDRAAEWGLGNVRPLYAYRHIYPFPLETTARLVHYFDFDYADGRAPSQYTAGLRRAVAGWHAQDGHARLELHEDGARLEIVDTRPGAARPLTVLAGVERLAYLGLDAGQTLGGLHAELRRSLGEAAPSPAQLQGWLTDWLAARLVFQEGDRYLSLATDPTRRVRLPGERFSALLAEMTAPPLALMAPAPAGQTA